MSTNFNNDYSDDVRDGFKPFKKIIWWVIGVVILASAIGWVTTRSSRTIDTAFTQYEEFQTLYNTCQKLNTDLCNMRELPEKDQMFEQFSKAQRINTLKTQLNRWVEDYNAKSKMWNRDLWKSKTLPYQLSVDEFKCYAN
jgi:hypothetical protein